LIDVAADACAHPRQERGYQLDQAAAPWLFIDSLELIICVGFM
jgi:hypothetical protein